MRWNGPVTTRTELFDPDGPRPLHDLIDTLALDGWRLQGPGEAVEHDGRTLVRYVFVR